MIKQLLSLATVATMAFSANAEIKTLWESSSAEGEQVNWSTQIPGTVFTAADCANYNGGDKIIVTVVKFDAALDAYPQIALKDGSWGDLAAGVVVKNMTMPNDVTFSLTPTQVATMKEKGWSTSPDPSAMPKPATSSFSYVLRNPAVSSFNHSSEVGAEQN